MPKVKINKVDMLVLIDNGNYYDKNTHTSEQLGEMFGCTASAVRASVKRCQADGLLKKTGKKQNWAYPVISMKVTKKGYDYIESEGENEL